MVLNIQKFDINIMAKTIMRFILNLNILFFPPFTRARCYFY